MLHHKCLQLMSACFCNLRQCKDMHRWRAGWSGDLQSLLRAASISAAADGLSDIFDDVDEVVGGAKARHWHQVTCWHSCAMRKFGLVAGDVAAFYCKPAVVS